MCTKLHYLDIFLCCCLSLCMCIIMNESALPHLSAARHCITIHHQKIALNYVHSGLCSMSGNTIALCALNCIVNIYSFASVSPMYCIVHHEYNWTFLFSVLLGTAFCIYGIALYIDRLALQLHCTQ